MIKPGMLISDRYEIIEKVGSGGMADVYKAKCHRLNRFVAIKVLKPEFSSDRSFVNKFRGEAQSAAGLSHPNIVNVYDVGDDDGLHYIVMELVEGITLKKFIERKGKLEVKEAIGISIQIAQGMEAAHANHIIHRDIKPQNIIISKEGKVKVTDFGIAKATTSNTITSNAMGSVHYLSPEQARGGYSDEKSDIYSLGVTMYEMLSGQVPFVGDNNVSVALAHIQGEAVPLKEINPDIPHGVDMIVQKCMQKKPERRYLSASDLIVDLKKAIANPNGDFVQLTAPFVTDSPTISLSDDDMNKIKNSSTSSMEYERKQAPAKEEEYDEEDDDIDAVDPRITKILISLGIPVVIAIVCLVVWLVTRMVSNLSDNNKNATITETPENPFPDDTDTPTPSIVETTGNIKMINVMNMTAKEAEDALKALSSKFEITYDEQGAYSDEIEKGKVARQFPSSDSEIAEDSKIVLTLSLGQEKMILDDYVGMDSEDASKALYELDFVVTVSEVSNDEMDAGKVISTVPEAGTTVEKGDKIVLVVSKGSEQVAVPKVIKMTEKEAVAALENAGLKVGKITRDSSDDIDEGLVMYQSYSKGEKVKAGTKVDLSISTGPKETPTPTPEVTKTPEPSAAPEPEEPNDGNDDGDDSDESYYGTLRIDENPFAEGVDSAQVQLTVSIDGDNSSIYKKNVKASEFPLTIPNVESSHKGVGTVTMYIDGVEYPKTWKISFE